jgi:hypothetical protein
MTLKLNHGRGDALLVVEDLGIDMRKLVKENTNIMN